MRMVYCTMRTNRDARACADTFANPGVDIKAIASYKGPLLPADEDERMRTVSCAVQNDEDDPVLSSICKLVCSLLRVPSAGLLQAGFLCRPQCRFCDDDIAWTPLHREHSVSD